MRVCMDNLTSPPLPPRPTSLVTRVGVAVSPQESVRTVAVPPLFLSDVWPLMKLTPPTAPPPEEYRDVANAVVLTNYWQPLLRTRYHLAKNQLFENSVTVYVCVVCDLCSSICLILSHIF